MAHKRRCVLTKSIKNVFVNWNKAKILDEQLTSWIIKMTKTNKLELNTNIKIYKNESYENKNSKY